MLCSPHLAAQLTVWKIDRDCHYIWLRLDSVDASQALFIGCVYFPLPTSKPFKFKSVTAQTMLQPLEEAIATLQAMSVQVFTIIVGDFDVCIDQHQAPSRNEADPLSRPQPHSLCKSQDMRLINERGREFLQLLHRHDILVANGMQRFPNSGGYTFTTRQKRKVSTHRLQMPH